MNTLNINDFVERSVPGDGDCAYHAFIASMKHYYPEVEIPSTVHVLKKSMLTYINKYNIDDTILINRINNNEWAQNEELELLSKMYNVCIAVWSSSQKLWVFFLHDDIPTTNYGLDGCMREIYIINKGEGDMISTSGMHFDYLIKRDTNRERIIFEEDSDTDEEYSDIDVEEENNIENNNDIDSDSEEQTFLKINQKEKTHIENLSLLKRFDYFRNKIELFDSTKDVNKIKQLVHLSKLIKPVKSKHRLTEYMEYFINNDNTLSVPGFVYTRNQKFLKKYLSFDTQNKSLLLFHGVGVGKTCSSILIAENFVKIFEKKILVILPSNLEANYRKELFDISKLNYETGEYESCNGHKYLNRIPNWNKMSKVEINRKVNKMINDDYQFLGYLKLVNFVEKLKMKSKQLHTEQEKSHLHFIMNIRDIFSNRVIIIDEIHNIRLSDDSSMKKFPKILVLILKYAYNVRLVALSATPMFDNPQEITWIMDFLYAADKSYKSFDTSIEFKNNKLTKSSIKNLEYFSKNYVSYMRGYDPNNFPITYYHEHDIQHPTVDMLTNEKIRPIKSNDYKFVMCRMGEQQIDIYENIEKNTDIQNHIQISNITYPQTFNEPKYSRGKLGFSQNFEIVDNKLFKVKYKNDDLFLTTNHIQKYSSKMYEILKHVEECNGILLIYSKYLYSGIIPLAIALEHMGYKKYNNNNILLSPKTEKKKGSYIIITAEDKLSPNNNEELKMLNDQSNIYGEKIKIALINEIASEGFTFKNVREIHLLEPWYNMNKINQIIGRGVRYKSHEQLPIEKHNVGLYLYINMLPNNNVESIDYRRYRFSINKQDKINQVENVIKSNSIDCILNDSNEISITKEITNSKNTKQLVKITFDNLNCTKIESKFKSNYVLNKRLLILDIIELSKNIKAYIEDNNLLKFNYDSIQEYFVSSKELIKDALHYLCKNKTNVVINGIHGYLIGDENDFFFQPKSIEDKKISLTDRKTKASKYIKKYKLSSNELISSDVNIDSMINAQIDSMRKEFKYINDTIDESILYDMIIDRLIDKHLKDLVIIDNPKINKSLEDGLYIFKNSYYNVYENSIYNKNTHEKSGYIKSNELIKELKNTLKRKKNYGFLEKDKKDDIKLKIRHLLHDDGNIKGSVCISTSSFKTNTLVEYINQLNNKIGKIELNKKNLCTLYEYYLRKNDLFARPVEHTLMKN